MWKFRKAAEVSGSFQSTTPIITTDHKSTRKLTHCGGRARHPRGGWPNYLDRRGISEKKWVEARRWAGGRTSKKKYKMLKSHRPDDAVAGSTKRLPSRYYQLNTGHARTGQYLHWAKARPTAQCWWCRCPPQTRDHLFRVSPEWKMQQKALWAEVQKETGRRKSRWKIRDQLADGKRGQAVLDFLSSTDVGRIVPPLEESDSGSFFFVYSLLACDLSDHGEIIYSPCPVCCPRSGGSFKLPFALRPGLS